MNIDQLLEYNKETSNKFNSNRSQKGFRTLGTGAFANVYSTKNAEMVLKVFHNDPGYLHFLKVVLANHTNPCFPKIGKLSKMTTGEYAGLYVVKSEILGDLYPTDFYHNFGFLSYLYTIGKDKTESFWEVYQRGSISVLCYNGFTLRTNGYGGDCITPENVHEYAKEWSQENKDMAAALDIIVNNAGNGINMDLHYKNVMQRPNGEWVIVDPYYDHVAFGKLEMTDSK